MMPAPRVSLSRRSSARSEFSYLATVPGVLPSIAERSSQTLSLIDARAAQDIEDAAPAPEMELPDGELPGDRDDMESNR